MTLPVAMGAQAYTVAFEGVEARLVEVQCAVTAGLPGFSIVGLPDKAVSEARDRVRSALSSLSIAMPSRRITVNLSPADLPKEGSHFDLPIALALLTALEAIPEGVTENTVSLGELSLDGTLAAVVGALPAAVAAAAADKTLLCPLACGPEAAWVSDANVIAGSTLLDLMRHLTGKQLLPGSSPARASAKPKVNDLGNVRGHERAKRALEIAAAGRHHLLMVGTPGSGKSMMAACLPGLLPALSPREALETSMIHSVAGILGEDGLVSDPPIQDPHHSASEAAMVGGGRGAKPGLISLAHNGVLFLDELPEFSRNVLESLRQPLETGRILVSRAATHVAYPSRFLLVAAANPCRCGFITEPDRACSKAPVCGEDYLARISGPLMDRFDLRIEVPPVPLQDLDLPPTGPSSSEVAARVSAARARQNERYRDDKDITTNADAGVERLTTVAQLDTDSREMLQRAGTKFGLSGRGYHRVIKVALTIADLAGAEGVQSQHLAEALSFRIVPPRAR